jgi:hypothetical protein
MPITGIYRKDKQMVEQQLAEAEQGIIARENLVVLDRQAREQYLIELYAAIASAKSKK